MRWWCSGFVVGGAGVLVAVCWFKHVHAPLHGYHCLASKE